MLSIQPLRSPVLFSAHKVLQAKVAGEELESLLLQKGLNAMVFPSEVRPNSKQFNLMIFVSAPDTSAQAKETLRKLSVESIVDKRGEDYTFKGHIIKISDSLGIKTLGTQIKPDRLK